MTHDDGKITVPARAALRRSMALGHQGLVAALILAAEAAGLIVLLLRAGHHVLLPVTVDLASGTWGTADTTPRLLLERIDVGVAAVVVLLIVAAARLLPMRRNLRWVEFSLVSSIAVFLVAQLNGVTDIGALVAMYALTSAMVLFAALQERTEVWRGHHMLPLCFGAAVGIVPWGIIAFHQVGEGLAGGHPGLMVRVITLVMLASALAFGVTQWRELAAAPLEVEAHRGARTHLALSVVSVSAFAWLVVLGVVLPAA